MFWDLFLISALTIFVYMTLFFFLSLMLKDSSIVDIGWGIGFIVVAIITLLISQNYCFKQISTTVLTFIWGIRLALHIFFRNKGKGEDWRYKQWRRDWKEAFIPRAFFQIFMLQGFLMLVISTQIIFIISSTAKTISFFDIAGIFIWLLGFLFESIGDYQLMRFKKKPENKGRIMKYGLWKYTRHPNYFGEVTLWWGIFLIALSMPKGYLTIISPLTITFLILKVSGIPLLEKKYKDNKEFQEYKKVTSGFFPWFQKKSVLD